MPLIPGVYSVVQYPPCRCRESLPQRSLMTTSSFTDDSLNSQASSSGLFHSDDGRSHSPSLKMMRGPVAGDEVFELRDHVRRDVPWLVRQPERVVPLVERVVEAHLEALGAHRRGEVACQVATRPDLDAVPGTAPGPGRLAARPQGESLVVLGGQRDVPGARSLKHVGPVIGVEEFGPEHRGEVLVGEVRAVDALVKSPGTRLDGVGAALLPGRYCIPVPLRVRQFTRQHGRIGRHRVNAPVDEDAELGVREPGRRGPAVQRRPIGLIRLRKQRGCSKQQRYQEFW